MTGVLERVCVVDETDREVTVVSRQEMRAQNLLHRSVAVACWNSSGEIFVHQRAAQKDLFPNRYDMFVGGVVAAGESYETAAVRELREELGIDGVGPEFLFKCLYRGPHSQAHIAVYRVTWDGPLVLQRSEVQGGQFWSPPALQERIAEGLALVPDGALCWSHCLERGLVAG